MEPIFMSIERPDGMTDDEAVRRAKALIPCTTGDFEVEQSLGQVILGNLECEAGFYDKNPDGAEYGPDDMGVKVSWETP